jgi:hypothetical protein
VLVVGSPRSGTDHLLALDLPTGAERVLPVREVLDHPERHFADLKENEHA